MPVYQRKGKANHWLIKFDLDGKTHYGSHQGRKSDAKSKEARMRAEVEATGEQRQKALTFAAFIETIYRPWAIENKRSYATADAVYLKPLLAFFGEYRLSAINPFLIEQFKRKRRDEPTHRGRPRSPSSVNRELECLAKILTLKERCPVGASDDPRPRMEKACERLSEPPEPERARAFWCLPPAPFFGFLYRSDGYEHNS